MTTPRYKKPEQEMPKTGEWNGLFAGPAKISGDPLDPFAPKKNEISQRNPAFLAPAGGQPGIKGDHPDSLDEPINERKKSFK